MYVIALNYKSQIKLTIFDIGKLMLHSFQLKNIGGNYLCVIHPLLDFHELGSYVN
jgi:hypothetical protein